MKIVHDYPPNYRDIVEKLPPGDHKPIYAYGDIIYNPHKVELTKDFEIHEAVHSRQQGKDPEIWWYKYLHDTTFRAEQEIEAYGEQLAYIQKANPPTNFVKWLLEQFSFSLSSELYGNILTYQEAETRIKRHAKKLSDGKIKP